MSDLFGVGGSFDAKTTGGPQMMSVAAGVAAAGAGADDDFLADFRSSIAKLEREARAAEGGGGGGGIQGLSPVDEGEKTRRTTATRRERDDDDDDDDVRASFDDGERPAWRPAGSPLRNRHAADERPPPRSPMKSPPGKPPLSPIKRAAAPTRPPRSPPPARASESALSQLRSKRVEARAAAGLDRDPPRLVERSWSADDNEGLKELFASATEYEREEAARDASAATARPKDAESEDDDSATDRATAGDRSVPESIASSEPETSAAPAPAPLPPKPPRGPVTAATLAEKRALEKEVRRLVAERAELMGTGAYSSSDRVIALIDEKITEITRRVARG
jgi:centrosomal protein CEP120